VQPIKVLHLGRPEEART